MRAAGRGTVIVWGLVVRQPIAGLMWQCLHHVAGLRNLGFDVWYVEDSDSEVFDPVTWWPTLDADANIRFALEYLERFGFGDRCFLRRPTDEEPVVGGTRDDLQRLYRTADVVINLSGAQELRDTHADIRCLVYLDTDPVEPQVRVAQGDAAFIEMLDRYSFLFTYGANLGAPDCPIPLERYTWHPTRPPVVVDWWETEGAQPPREALTTVLNFRHAEKDVSWDGEPLRWSKDGQFAALSGLPRRSPLALELSIGAIEPGDEARLVRDGWRVRPSLADPDEYRAYVRSSLGEFSVAKEQYVRGRCGWFSDRSACYLAAGRPVIAQDTGVGGAIGASDGYLTFSSEDEALAAVGEVAGNYDRHAVGARALARDYFSAETVLGDVLRTVGLL